MPELKEDFYAGLVELGQRKAPEYAAAYPYPHIALDGVFPGDVLERALDSWPRFEDVEWKSYNNDNEKAKDVIANVELLGSGLRDVLLHLISPSFVDFLEELTGIPALSPDPTFLECGIFDVKEGGFLNLHTDFLVQRRTGLHRRVNVLVYLNHDWTEDNGGELELWDIKKNICGARIFPLFNRMAIFSTTPDALHGHPNPVRNAPKGSRKCLSVFYYTKERPFKEAIFGSQGVLFAGEDRPSPSRKLKAIWQQLSPPALRAAIRSARHRPS